MKAQADSAPFNAHIPQHLMRSPAWSALSSETLMKFAQLRCQLQSSSNGALMACPTDLHVAMLEGLGFLTRTSPPSRDGRGRLRAAYRFTDLPWIEPGNQLGASFPPSHAYTAFLTPAQARIALSDCKQRHRRSKRCE